MNKFSIIMPSNFGNYPNAASEREKKIIRAIESVINQTYDKWELIIIADGCMKTKELLTTYFYKLDCNYNIRLLYVPKQKQYSGVRNFGIDAANGDYIIYLDIDDFYSKDYLLNLSNEITDHDWYFVDDLKLKYDEFKRDRCDISLGKCGTSNVIHKRSMKARWNKSDYGEDYQFIKILKKESNNLKRLETVGYNVCHIPNKYDV